MQSRRANKRTKRKKPPLPFLLLILTLSLMAGLFFLFQQSRQDEKEFKSQEASLVSKEKTPQKSQTTTSDAIKEKETSEPTWQQQETPVTFPILMYHAVHVMDPSEAASANLIVDPDVFESHIKRLVDEGYYFLTPEEAYRALNNNELPSEKVIWLTFDDSMVDFYNIAYPILKKYQAKATNNVITGFTEEGRVSNLSVEQMIEMKKDGMSFEGHTVTHPDLEMSDQATQTFQMEESKRFLDEQLQQNTMTIAYPAGRYSDLTISLAKESYQLGLTTNEGLASASNGLLTLNRVRILPSTTADLLMATIEP
ncbi:polysaccharide deacetylase family protein [Streptococcus pacificus]|uniref:Polysaccharide deacetylase family protein n=1 Tax=Streptococcus pacificus TaxID=2740577 RepID=A0ABS0ZHA1_9STRE|nr:polysaccharide deacetylase family protein [Streptococcus pacificus]MBJ8325384.1 polysaccharide deacetylase family protein [Streptococcus pacificus]